METKSHFLSALLSGILLAAGCASTHAAVVDYSLAGWVGSDGSGNGALNPNNTFTGNSLSLRYNSWASFSIPTGSYTSAILNLTPATAFGTGSFVVDVFDVSTPLTILTTSSTTISTYQDLMTGSMYGQATLADAPVSFALNSAAVSDINLAAGGTFIIGFTNATMNALPATQTDGIYTSGVGNANGQIPLTLTLNAAVPELSTWGMMILGFCGLGCIAYRRRKSAGLAT